MSISSISAAVPQPEKTTAPMFYVVSVRKMFALTFFTLGFYVLYWTYRNWEAYKRATGNKIIPILRAVFAVFFLYALLKRVDRGFCTRGLSYKWSPALLVLGMVGTIALSFIPLSIALEINSPYWFDVHPRKLHAVLSIMYFLTFSIIGVQLWIMALIQQAINVHEGDSFGGGNDLLTDANCLWMLPGLLYWTLFIGSWALSAFRVAQW